MRLPAGAWATRGASKTTPRIAHDVGVLHPELELSLRSIVEAIPEPKSGFVDTPRIARAAAQSTRNESGGPANARRNRTEGSIGRRGDDRLCFGPAAGVCKARVSISFIAD